MAETPEAVEVALERVKRRDLEALLDQEEPLVLSVAGMEFVFPGVMTTEQWLTLQARGGEMHDRDLLALFGIPREHIDRLDPKRLAAVTMAAVDHFFGQPRRVQEILENPVLISAAYTIGQRPSPSSSGRTRTTP
jgi:hypothetical protein